MDLIFAEATPPGRGGISIIRLSGSGARDVAERLVGPLPVARRTYCRNISEDGDVLDQALVFRAEEGASFTGEDLCEFHLHGAPVVVRRVSAALARAGARPAQAGEFTRRAFLNGRLDLAEIEGLGDLLAAETEAQRQQAIRSSSGELAQKAAEWRKILVRAGALVEASVDFAEEDAPDEVPAETYGLIADLTKRLQDELQGFAAAERVRLGFEVAIIGPPNAGKSSLLNRLARRDAAIVSEIAGTTRDVLELRMDLRGLAVTVLDTAGIRDAGDDIERMGIDAARKRAQAADLRIHLSPSGARVDDLWRDGDLVVQSKSDLFDPQVDLAISALTGSGIAEVLTSLFEILSSRVSGAGLISHERQFRELSEALAALDGAADYPAEILAEQLRMAAFSLDRLLGRIDSEDYLDVIFSSFCIGK
ncbi:MAG: tRNA uridine-5-carboxymethylaminomethyl(34) synthesis GTPase MnmE [Paracoccus sp. (in: a-proteobacteria)]|uniref:tRNA uridine-5-carboxymethylaminomethyl(34) synthesis GTPase MnmE n=1 Tax=Paracoccus sp. TaxID=267 RepID=UPI00391D583E